MHSYELMVIFDPSYDEKSITTSLTNYLKVITNGGGTVDKVDCLLYTSPSPRD